MPPLGDAYNATGQAAQIAQNMFSPATNVLSSALNNAVDAGRRMVDLQSHQEDIFLSEREKLRLATERKGLEARRIFENDRNFGEDVLRDRRNFDESVFQDRRDFGLESQYKMGMLGIQQGELGLREQEMAAKIGMYNEHGALYKAQAAAGGYRGRYGAPPKPDIFNDTLREAAMGRGDFTFQSTTPAVRNAEGKAMSSPADLERITAGQDILNTMRASGLTRRDAQKSYLNPSLADYDRAVTRQMMPYLPDTNKPPSAGAGWNSGTGTDYGLPIYDGLGSGPEDEDDEDEVSQYLSGGGAPRSSSSSQGPPRPRSMFTFGR